MLKPILLGMGGFLIGIATQGSLKFMIIGTLGGILIYLSQYA